ncbi:lipoprotein [Streptomyces badius]
MIYDYGATTVEQKKKRLLTDPALADVPAIKNKRFAVMPLSDAVLGVRVPAAVDKLAAQLHPEAVKAATTP